MRSANLNQAVYVDPTTRQFTWLATGSDFCAEHECPVNAIFHAFGSKLNIESSKLFSGEFEPEDFIANLEDCKVKNQDLLLLVSVNVPVPDKFYFEGFSVSLDRELQALHAQLAERGAPFDCEGVAQPFTFLVTRDSMLGKKYRYAYAVERYNMDASEKVSMDAFIQALNDGTDPEDAGILNIKDPVMSQITLSLVNMGTRRIESLRDYMFLRHVQAQGLDAPVLAGLLLDMVPLSSRKLPDLLEQGLIRSQIISKWTGPWSVGGDVELLFGSFDPEIGDALKQLFKAYREGNLLVSRPTEAGKSGMGICLHNLNALSPETIAGYERNSAKYRDAMVALRDKRFFHSFNEKAKALADVVSIELERVYLEPLDESLIVARRPGKAGTYLKSERITNDRLLLWFEGKISDITMLSEHFQKRKSK